MITMAIRGAVRYGSQGRDRLPPGCRALIRRVGLPHIVMFLVASCAGASATMSDFERHAMQSPAASYSCDPGGTLPPTKLLLPASGGISGQYIVQLVSSVQDVPVVAGTLSTKYSGRVIAVFTTALHGFAVVIDDASAPLLAQEADVCWVEQDAGAQAG